MVESVFSIKEKASVLVASIIRTIVPIIAGQLIFWGSKLGILADTELTEALEAFIAVVLTAAYYVCVRLLETFVTPKFGILLGMTRAPSGYANPLVSS